MKKGFTIIESLVAIAILALVIIGASSAVQSALSSYIFSKDQIVAFYLAQEGIERIRLLRDYNRINGRPWLTDISAQPSDPCYFGYACKVDLVVDNTLTPCTNGTTCPVMRQDPEEGFYGYNADWSETPFTRTITIKSINNSEIAVTVLVEWSKGLTNRQYKATANLLDW